MSSIRLFLNLLVLPGPRYSWKKVLFFIFFSLLPISGAFLFSYLYSTYFQYWKKTSKIKVIAQTTSESGSLPTFFLAEALDLSKSYPLDFDQFDETEMLEKLHATHIMKKTNVHLIKPDTLFICYELRKPFAKLGNFTNTLVSEEGFLIPCFPFYTPKRLPEIYLHDDQYIQPWGNKIEERNVVLIRQLQKLLKGEEIIGIDLSKINAQSSGQREIIVRLRKKILRLTPSNFEEELSNYFMLKKIILDDEEGNFVLDLRIPKVAYLQKTTSGLKNAH